MDSKPNYLGIFAALWLLGLLTFVAVVTVLGQAHGCAR